MVLLNGKPIQFINFPDGTLKIDIPDIEDMDTDEYYTLEWHYENDAEFMQVAFIKMHLDNNVYTNELASILYMPYVVNARMDRQKADSEVFTLKYFAKLINNLHFDEVVVLDPHSYVSEALFDHLTIISAEPFIDQALETVSEETGVKREDIVLFFPDEGSQKRYKTDSLTDHVSFFGNKVREWKSGHILGVNIETHTDKGLDYLKDKTVLIIDDIISAGGTVYYSIKELEKHNVKNVYAYCSHLENTMFIQKENKLRDMLNDNSTLKGIITTDSIYNGEHDFVTVLSSDVEGI